MNFFVLFVCCLLNNWHIGFQIITCRRVGSVNHNSRDEKGGLGTTSEMMDGFEILYGRPSVRQDPFRFRINGPSACLSRLSKDANVHLPPQYYLELCVCV